MEKVGKIMVIRGLGELYAACVNYTVSDIEYLRDVKEAFVCPKCASRIKLRSNSSSTSTNESSEDQPMTTKHSNQLMKKMSDNLASLNTFYKDLRNDVAEIKTCQTAAANSIVEVTRVGLDSLCLWKVRFSSFSSGPSQL
ncbi:hypothetical protein HHI36_003765 [Cryptolaemus montrouzieri]|uniref:Uncharacterized protein n=1 Tax=Cryptolaemus montrouzieri TaxID=559131 RepID=A0ABD2NP91_9CUCU